MFYVASPGRLEFAIMTPSLMLTQIIRRLNVVVVAVPLREPRELPVHHEDRGVAGRPGGAQVSQSPLGHAVPLNVPRQHQ